jgi:hypothetical protein
MRRYRYFDDAVCITENFKRFADTAFTYNYRPTFKSYDELEPQRFRYAAKEEQDTRIISCTLNQIQDELQSQPSIKQLITLLHQAIDLRKLCHAIRDYQKDSKNYSGFQPEYWHPEYNPKYFSLLVEFAQFLTELCVRLLHTLEFVMALILKSVEADKPSSTSVVTDSPPVPPPIFLRPQIQPNSPNFAA